MEGEEKHAPKNICMPGICELTLCELAQLVLDDDDDGTDQQDLEATIIARLRQLFPHAVACMHVLCIDRDEYAEYVNIILTFGAVDIGPFYTQSVVVYSRVEKLLVETPDPTSWVSDFLHALPEAVAAAIPTLTQRKLTHMFILEANTQCILRATLPDGEYCYRSDFAQPSSKRMRTLRHMR